MTGLLDAWARSAVAERASEDVRGVVQTCAHCGTDFTIAKARLRHGRGKHCSKICQYAAARTRPKKAKLVLTCIGCGRSFERGQSWLRDRKGAGKFCSRLCRDEHRTGPLNSCWQGGSGSKRGPHWQATRRAIKARDVVCQHCGSDRDLHVHHEVPFRVFRTPEEANDLDNLTLLCAPCHRTHEARMRWVITEPGVALSISAGGYAHELARSRGLMS